MLFSCYLDDEVKTLESCAFYTTNMSAIRQFQLAVYHS